MKSMKNSSKGLVKSGSAIVLVLFIIILLSIMGVGLLSLSYGARLNAIRMKNETVATLSAEAGYEKAVFWMAQQDDMLFKMKSIGSYTDSFTFENSSCVYTVRFNSFIGSRPIYKITSIADVGQAQRAVEVLVSQDIGGWDMGMCRVPDSGNSTIPVNFADGEEIDMPIHINSYGNNKFDSAIDIHIVGNPTFLRPVSMGESRTSSGGADKYSSIMNSFTAGIDFLQPESQISDESAIAAKVAKFGANTKLQFVYTPNQAGVLNLQKTVQLEFYVDNGVGKVRITNNCAVQGYQRASNVGTLDWMVRPNSNATKFDRYFIYSYHFIPATGNRFVYNMEDTYVTQEVGGVSSAPGGQIFVNGNVVIGGNLLNHNGNQVVKGNITVVATGNIWIADSIIMDGSHETSTRGVPSSDNPNALGLIAQGVVKIVDPGMTEYGYINKNGGANGMPDSYPNLTYEPIGIPQPGYANTSDHRVLPDPLIIEAVITVGGGGFGAENVKWDGVGGRKEYSGIQDDLIFRGALAEAIRGVVGLVSSPQDGFIKKYYVDERVLQGILPGDMWLKRKYIPTAAGWSDYRP